MESLDFGGFLGHLNTPTAKIDSGNEKGGRQSARIGPMIGVR